MNSPFENQINYTHSPLKANGRLGRLSYIAWMLLLSILAMLLIAPIILSGLDSLNNPTSIESFPSWMLISIFIVYLIGAYFNIIIVIRRLHDRNHTGWLALLMLVPFVNLFFMIYLFAAKGTEGSNDYGPQRPTLGWERVLGWIYIVIIPLVFIFAIITAIMAPTYEGYIEKSESIVIGTPSQSQ
ncbi:DUF805 domain-containing protein [Acinetobacter sp. XS-4]|uniref:DUF805 domain-containing protein n=1 Tax=Acinetobacter sp. XS-4 TaxID=2923375 RepID=UPI00208E2305|nr:DUF805 domain-containing protein [Acinetobacter sp. XS-4]USP40757.1 DUF805 domain-containing protein [Acinetobacter sp. XS-4]